MVPDHKFVWMPLTLPKLRTAIERWNTETGHPDPDRKHWRVKPVPGSAEDQ